MPWWGLINHFRSVQVPLLFILGLILDLKFMFLSSLRFVFQLWLSIVWPCRVALPWWAPSMRAVEKRNDIFAMMKTAFWWGFWGGFFFQIPRDSECLYEDLKERPSYLFPLRTFFISSHKSPCWSNLATRSTVSFDISFGLRNAGGSKHPSFKHVSEERNLSQANTNKKRCHGWRLNPILLVRAIIHANPSKQSQFFGLQIYISLRSLLWINYFILSTSVGFEGNVEGEDRRHVCLRWVSRFMHRTAVVPLQEKSFVCIVPGNFPRLMSDYMGSSIAVWKLMTQARVCSYVHSVTRHASTLRLRLRNYRVDMDMYIHT